MSLVQSGLMSRSLKHLMLMLVCSIFVPACSRQNSAPASATAPPRQPVSVSEVDRLLTEGHVATQQLAEQIVRQTKPFRGMLNVELNLTDTDLTDEKLKALTLPDSLTRVNLTHTLITDDGLAHLLTGKNIVELTLTNTRITSQGLVHLRAMPNLRKVNLHDTDVPPLEQVELLRFLNNRPQN